MGENETKDSDLTAINTIRFLAVDMVEISKLRTVIDLWVEAEAA